MSLPNTTARRHTLLVVLLALVGLLGLGRLALAAWLDRPQPGDLPSFGARTDEARPFLLVVIDGLHEQAWNDPRGVAWLRRFALRGAWGIALTGEPTLTAPCVRAIVSGRRPDVLTGFQNFQVPAVEGNLLHYLAERGGTLAHAGDAAIYQLCRPSFEGARVFQVPDQGPTDQGQTDAAAVPFALDAIDAGCDVVSIHLTKVDHAGHKYGATGEEYLEACRVVDAQVQRVVTRFVQRHPEATVLVASDHGVSARGTHGGGELSARRAPFSMVGPNIARVPDVEIDQSALAPTVALAMGLPQPPLADAPPRPELTTLPPALRQQGLEAYIQARSFVARSVAGDGVDAIARRRAALSVEVSSPSSAWMALADDVNALVNPSAAGLALCTLLLAWAFVVSLLHLARGPPLAPRSATFLGFACGAAALALLNVVPISTPVVIVVLGAACLVPWWLHAERGAVGVWAAGACLSAVPVLTGAGQTFQAGFTHPETAQGAGQRIWLVLAGAVIAIGVLARPTVLWARLRQRFRAHPVAWLALVGTVIGFGTTLRPFVDNVVHTLVLYALAAAAVAWAIARSPGARAAPRARWGFLLVAGVLFLGIRAADGWFGESWVLRTDMRDPLWLGIGAVVTALGLGLLPRTGWRGAHRVSWVAAGLALGAAFAFRLIGADTLESAWGRAGSVTFGLGISVLALGAIFGTTNRGTADGRLCVRIVGALALARRLSVLDAEYAAFAFVAVGAVFASSFVAARTRFGIAKLAMGLLLLRTGVLHAMGFEESFSTLDVGQAFAGLGKADDPAAFTGGEGAVTWQVQVATVQVALRMALPWILIFAALMRAAGRNARSTVRQATADLAVGFGARGAVIVAALWVWWHNRWWMTLAYTVFAYTVADLLLSLFMALLVGAWRREPASDLARPLPPGDAGAKMPA